MSSIKEVLRWEYGVEKRHLLLIISATFIGVGTYFYSLPGETSTVITISFGVSLLPFVWAVWKAPFEEKFTLGIWSFMSSIGMALVSICLHLIVAPQISYDGFIAVHPIGLASIAIIGVLEGLLLLILVFGLVDCVGKLWNGRNRGQTPEEQVLSDEEQANFEPLDNDTQSEIDGEETPIGE